MKTDEDRGRALRVAAMKGDLEGVNALLAEGVLDIDAPDPAGWTPLMMAGSTGAPILFAFYVTGAQ